MFRMIRGLIGLAVIGGLVYAAVYVPLGEKTLWEHIKAIAGTKESKELVKDVKDKAGEVKKKAAKAIEKVGSGSGTGDRLTKKERDQLRDLIRKRMGKGSGKGSGSGSAEKKKP